jgi:hypothetical protein
MTGHDRTSIGIPAMVWAVVLILANVWVAYRTGDVIRDLVVHIDPRWKVDLWWYLPLSLALTGVAILALAAVILRYKAGVVALIVVIAVNIVLGTYVAGVRWMIFMPLIGAAVLIALLRPRWDDMR